MLLEASELEDGLSSSEEGGVTMIWIGVMEVCFDCLVLWRMLSKFVASFLEA